MEMTVSGLSLGKAFGWICLANARKKSAVPKGTALFLRREKYLY